MRLTEKQRSIIWIAVVAVVYFAVARLSLSILMTPAGIAAVWPPEGIFLSAILLTRRETRPWLIGVLFATDLLGELVAGTSLFVSMGYSLALAGSAGMGSWLILRFLGPSISFSKVREVFGFLALSVFLANLTMSLLAAAVSTRTPGSAFWESWRTWATSDGIGNLLVTPCIITWARARAPVTWDPRRWIEGVSLVIPLAVITFFAFGAFAERGEAALPLTYLCFPLLLWAALRFDLRFLTTSLAGMAAIAVGSTLGAGTPSPLGLHVDDVILVQLFLATMAIPALVLAATVAERKESLEALGKSEALLSSVVEGTSDAVYAKDREGRYLLLNDVARKILGKSLDELLGRDFSGTLVADHTQSLAEQDRQVLDSREPHTYQEKLTLADGQEHTFLSTKSPLLGPGGEVVGLLGVARDITELARSQEERDRLRERMVNAQEEERRRIAADIHDDSIQQMTAVGLRLGALRHLVASGGSDDGAFASLEESVEKAIGRLRHLMFELRPPALDEQGLVAAIVGYVGTESREGGFRFDVRDRLQQEPEASVRAGLYRIVQEAVRNVSKHAEANSITVTVSSEKGGVGLEIQDDGQGFGAQETWSPDHFGLAGIRERASMMGGSATVQSSRGAGTRVKIWVPSHHGPGAL